MRTPRVEIEAVAAAGRVVGGGVAECDGVGDLRDHRTRGGAHDLLDLRRLDGRRGFEVGRIDGEGADLDRHLAVDIGAVKLVGGTGDRAAGCLGLVGRGGVGEDAHGIVGRHLLGELVVLEGEGGVDLGERPELDEVALALAGDGRHLDDLAAGYFLMVGADAVAFLAEDDVGQIGDELGKGVG